MRSTLLLLIAVTGASLASAADSRPQFRGLAFDGTAGDAVLSLTWSEMQRVPWQTAVHDRRRAPPVVADDQVWLATATKDGARPYAVRVAFNTGKIVHDAITDNGIASCFET